MGLVVTAVTDLVDPAILAPRVVVPDRADGHAPASLHDLEMDVVHLAASVRPLFGGHVDHVVGAGREIHRAVDVEHVHPATGVNPPLPAPCIRTAAVLLLGAEYRRGQ